MYFILQCVCACIFFYVLAVRAVVYVHVLCCFDSLEDMTCVGKDSV